MTFESSLQTGASPGSVLGEGIRVVGDIVSGEKITIAGGVEGTIKCSGTVVIAASGQVSASVEADSIVIAGSVRGAVEATNAIDIRGSAHLVGDIKCARIIIEDGAYFKGSIDIGRVPQGRGNTEAAIPMARQAAGGR